MLVLSEVAGIPIAENRKAQLCGSSWVTKNHDFLMALTSVRLAMITATVSTKV
ncbi:hypothetical protein K8B83_04035 [Shewanella inventionis]|uniref:hypothetical protein n=1 Tax=Shewanella inventionis TaxID=1738770 RepID=UPI001CBF4BDD|nr:hypothetical protein [Shewanella inventionis]UAL44031.1 hypothetical protein K8B83_04035 [Shewanella inventionis]